jgi:hypothetical protein
MTINIGIIYTHSFVKLNFFLLTYPTLVVSMFDWCNRIGHGGGDKKAEDEKDFHFE